MKDFEEYNNFYNSTDVKKAMEKELEKIGFDFENYKPVLVQFKNPNKLYTGKKYLYKIHKYDSLLCRNGGLVIVPVYKNDNFELVKICDTFDDPSKDIFNSVNEIVETILDNKNKNTSKYDDIKQVALTIGTEDGPKLSPYFERIEKIKRKKLIMDKLDEEASKAQKILLYKTLSQSNPEIKKLLDELDELNNL